MRITGIHFAAIFLVFFLGGMGLSLIAWWRSDSWQKKKQYLILATGLGFLAGLSLSIGIALDARLISSVEVIGFLPFALLISLFFTILMVLIVYLNLRTSKKKQVRLQRFRNPKEKENE